MAKSIYKITNLINGKIYIGQSNNPQRRFQEHIQGKINDFSLIHNAIQKYGKDNFILEIIEKDKEDYNEREKYWIQYYQSNNKKYGYNLTEGGEDPPILKGENNYFCKFSDEVIQKILYDLSFTSLSYKELAEKYSISTAYIKDLNNGKCRRNPTISYPIRKISNVSKKAEKVLQVIDQLENTSKTIEQIQKDLNINSNTIYDINKGKHKNCPIKKYPIREPFCKISTNMINNIIADLKNNKMQMKEIELKYNLSKSTISRINNGSLQRKENEVYPIRNSKHRVYKQNL